MVKIAIPEGTKPTDNLDAIPAGWYTVALASAEYKKRDGEQLDRIAYTFEVVDGEFKGRKIFGGWNVPSPNFKGTLDEKKQQAVQIADRHLASLILACLGEGQTCDDTDKLVGKVVSGKVKVRPAANGYEASNDITNFAKLGEEKKLPATSTAKANNGKPAGPAWAR